MSTAMNEIHPENGGTVYNFDGTDAEVSLAQSYLEWKEHVVVGTDRFFADRTGHYRPVEILPPLSGEDFARLRRLAPELGVTALSSWHELPI